MMHANCKGRGDVLCVEVCVSCSCCRYILVTYQIKPEKPIGLFEKIRLGRLKTKKTKTLDEKM